MQNGSLREEKKYHLFKIQEYKKYIYHELKTTYMEYISRYIKNFVFRTKLVDGTEVIQEVHAKPKTNYSSTGQGLFIFS